MLPMIARVLVSLVALIHVAIAGFEMFFWKLPVVHGRLGFTEAESTKAAPIVANAGLYNGFIAAGLIWRLLGQGGDRAMESFLLACLIVAGVFGAATLKWTTLVLQTLPGALVLLAVWMARPSA